MGFTLALFTHMDFDQNQKIGHFGKVTPPQRGRIPEIPIAVCFGAENPLIFRRKIASKSRNFPNFPENDPCLRVWVHILRKFKSLKFCPFFRIYPTTSRDWPGNATKRGFRASPANLFKERFSVPEIHFFPIFSHNLAPRKKHKRPPEHPVLCLRETTSSLPRTGEPISALSNPRDQPGS